jgi:hypothetical protein
VFRKQGVQKAGDEEGWAGVQLSGCMGDFNNGSLVCLVCLSSWDFLSSWVTLVTTPQTLDSSGYAFHPAMTAARQTDHWRFWS